MHRNNAGTNNARFFQLFQDVVKCPCWNSWKNPCISLYYICCLQYLLQQQLVTVIFGQMDINVSIMFRHKSQNMAVRVVFFTDLLSSHCQAHFDRLHRFWCSTSEIFCFD